MHIKQGDLVEMIKSFTSGSEREWKKGTRGKVLRVITEDEKLIVEGVKMVYRHLRRSQQHPRGARIEKEAPIHVSNVKLVCPSCQKAARVGHHRLTDGTKVRFCKKCRENIDVE